MDITIDSLEILKEGENKIKNTVEVVSDENAPNKYLKYINLSALTLLIFPFVNLIFTSLLYWVFQKNLTREGERQSALKIISFQILWSALILAMIIFIPALINLLFGVSELLDIPVFLWIYLVLVFAHLMITFDAAIALNTGSTVLGYVPNIL